MMRRQQYATTRGWLGRSAVVIGAALLVVTSAIGARASSVGPVEVVRAFDESPLHLPEGIAVDKSGDLYVSLGPPFFVGGGYGEVRRLGRDGSETTLFRLPDGPAPAGLAVDPSGTVFFAVPDPLGPHAGVYRIDRDGTTARLPGTEQMLVANGLALDKHGNLFASDSAAGAIWQMPADGSGDAAVWIAHELLAGCTPADLGANGVAFWKGDLFVANTLGGMLVRVPVGIDGEPGTPEVVAGDLDCEPDELFGMDGIAFDVHGQVYALLVLQHKLVKIDPSTGTSEVLLAPGDGLWNGASLAFGTGNDKRQSLFIANYAVLPPEPPNSLGPAIVEIDVGVPGLPLP